MKRFGSIVMVFACFVPTLFAQIPHFQHIIVVVQENRTPDNMFQGLCAPPYGNSDSCSINPGPNQYNIQTSNWYDFSNVRGYTQPQPVSFTAPYDLDHSHPAYREMCDNQFALNSACKMDGAAAVACTGTCPAKPQFRYVDNSPGELNPYLDIATQYGFANYMFQTNQGPSFPAHLYLFGGTSAPGSSDDTNGIFAAEEAIPGGMPTGCVGAMDQIVYLISPPGHESTYIYPCWDIQTMGDFPQAFPGSTTPPALPQPGLRQPSFNTSANRADMAANAWARNGSIMLTSLLLTCSLTSADVACVA